MQYTPTIGIEVHVELKTLTKMFCDSANDPDETRPNVNICPVCMGHPGTLPVINKEAVRHVLRVGAAVGGTLADYTEFDRKNYFYPDLPKGYQISQYEYPLVRAGVLGGVALTRIHLEEDTGRSQHEGGTHSLIDFNRAGVPLMELVTEPAVRSAEEARAFAKELQLLLRYLGASDANLEKGEMRIEANISVSKDADGKLGTKVEVKNLNSFKSVERAIAFEIKRQTKMLEQGERVAQETRGWDENKEKTFSQRKKEESHDYRYFPDPDLPYLSLSEIEGYTTAEIKKDLPELPWEKRARLTEQYGFSEKIIEMYVDNMPRAHFFESVCRELGGAREKVKLASNYITSDLINLLKSEKDVGFSNLKFSTEQFAKLVGMAHKREVSSRGAKDILAYMFKEGGEPHDIARKKKLLQTSDESFLNEVVEKVIQENQSVAEEYKAGKDASLQYLIGQGMKATKGTANPTVLKDLFIKELSKKR